METAQFRGDMRAVGIIRQSNSRGKSEGSEPRRAASEDQGLERRCELIRRFTVNKNYPQAIASS